MISLRNPRCAFKVYHLIAQNIGEKWIKIGSEQNWIKGKSSMATSLPVENLQPQNVGSIINYLQ